MHLSHWLAYFLILGLAKWNETYIIPLSHTHTDQIGSKSGHLSKENGL